MRTLFRTSITAFAVFAIVAASAVAQDTIVVKTLTFEDTTRRSGTWEFPPPQSYEKVLMEYTLKCDPATTQDSWPCGEWDYLTYTMVTDSTGEWDSTSRTQVNYVVRTSTPATFGYSNNPAPSKVRYRDSEINRSGGSGTWIDVGSGGQGNNLILTDQGGLAQFIWTATELTNAGLSAGPISGIRLRAIDSVDNVALMTVRIGQTNQTSIPSLMNSSMLTTVRRATTILNDSPNDLAFTTPYIWDGTSNIVVELSNFSAPETVNLTSGSTANPGRIDDGTRRAYAFKPGDAIILPTAVGDEISNEVTVAFWSWGDAALLPRNNNAFEAYNDRGQRVLNAHLPWSNGQVYWDAGLEASGGNDRIQLPAPEATYEGRWNHWAFVKNTAAGTMTIYHNGEVFHSEGGKTKTMTGITRFVFGTGGSGYYPGMLDEIEVWNKALDQATIQQWMTRQITRSHPDINRLLVYYTAEEDPNRMTAHDASGRGNHGELFGVPTPVKLTPDQLGYLTRSSSGRPYLSFESGSFSASSTRVDRVVDGVPVLTSVVRYRTDIEPRIYAPEAEDHPTSAVDTLLVQEAGWLPIFDEDGLVVDSHQVAVAKTLTRVDQQWFDPIVQFEIGRFITPYGIGLDLGPKGFKWVFDVSDYAPILRNNVTMSAGNQQELIDVTFKFITGTPPRSVKQIDQLWHNRSAEMSNVLVDTELTPQTVTLSDKATSFRVKTTSSGHRFDNPTNCAEFCERTHYITVGETRTNEWLLWTECGDNPVYPQGGTWLIDRAGWCPGDGVDIYDNEITSFVTPGTTVKIDYGIDQGAADDSYGQWVVVGQLFGYGAANHSLDAAIVDVIRPNDWEFYGRLNPICGEPEVIIQNTGSTTLTSATIMYGVDGSSTPSTFEWSGNLAFLEKDTVTLPTPSWPSSEGAFVFSATISAPNGGTDEYSSNDKQTRTAMMPPQYYSDLTIRLRTNNFAASQYVWQLRKIDGVVIDSGSRLADNTTYDYDFDLEDGCYEFELINNEGYGLDFWFLRNQLGTGSLTFLSDGASIKNFEPDFGNRAWIQFSVGAKATIQTTTDTLFFSGPIPEPIERMVAITPDNSAGLYVDSVNTFSVRNHYHIGSTSVPTPVDLAFGDTLWVTVVYDRPDVGTSNGSMRVYSNDERQSVKSVRLVGNIGTTGVQEGSPLSSIIEAGVFPNPITSDGQIVIDVKDPARFISSKIWITDALGQFVANIHEGSVTASAMYFAVPSGLAGGSYHVQISSPSGQMVIPFVVTR